MDKTLKVVRVDSDVLADAKAAAARRRTTLQEFAADALRNHTRAMIELADEEARKKEQEPAAA